MISEVDHGFSWLFSNHLQFYDSSTFLASGNTSHLASAYIIYANAELSTTDLRVKI